MAQLNVRNIVNVGQSMDTDELIIDSDLSTTSKNPVENRAITQTLMQKQDALTVAQLSAVNSGINTSKRTAYDNHISNADIHVTAAQKTAWSNKQDKLNAFTGADGANAGTSGIVPAPSSTDNVKYLKGDGTWASVDSLPSQTGNSGKFLTTNGTTASWATVQAGGGTPTLTWFANNTGTTLNTGLDLSNANLVKVYKNGSLLTYGIQPTEVQYTTYTGGTDKYLILSNYPDMTTVGTWSINCRFTWNLTDAGSWPSIFAESLNYDRGCPSLLVPDGEVVVWASAPDNFDLITGFETGFYPQVGETYDVILGYNRVKYYFKYKLKDSSTYTEVDILRSNSKVYWRCPHALLNQLRTSTTMDSGHNSSSIWIDFFKIYINGEIFFDGATATLGTDYINNNCTTSSQTGYITFDKYSINNQTITFTEPLIGTDAVCVEVF